MNKLTLRPYQEQCVEKLLWAHKLEGADVAVLPTGAGKSLIIAELAHKLNKPILILQPTKEILLQNYEKLSQYVDESEIGIYSASMSRKDIGFYTFATIQSIYKYPEKFQDFTTIIVDECHNIDPKNLAGMYTSFFKQLKNPKVIGVTATPWRMSLMYRHDEKLGLQAITTTKLINRMRPRFWHRLIFSMSHNDLVEQGFLCKLRYIDKSVIYHKDIPLNKSHSEFDLEKFRQVIQDKKEDMMQALIFAEQLATRILVFCATVEQAEELQSYVEDSVVVTSKTKAKDRAYITEAFKDGSISMVFNVGVYTTGYDNPALDCIVLARPTRSLALHTQMMGRGSRNSPGKKFCRIIDLVGNVAGMGRLETIKVVKREQWEIESETGSWHNLALDSFQMTSKEDTNFDRILLQSEQEGGE